MRRTALVIGVIALAALAVWLVFRGEGPGLFGGPPPVPDAAEAPALDVQRYVASDRFARLTREEQGAYLATLMNQPSERLVQLTRLDDLTDEEIERARHNLRGAFMGVMLGDAKACQALPEDRRDAFIDARMDEMLAKRAAVEEEFRRTGGRDPRFGPPWQGRRPDPDEISRMMEQMLSDTTPEERAILNEYHTRAMKRMTQRRIHDLLKRMHLAR